MTSCLDRKTVGEIAAENPASVRVFQKYGIDFCCGGKLPLAEACGARGIEIGALSAELQQAASGSAPDARDWMSATLAELIDHIVRTHHDYLKAELPRLDAMLAKVLAAHGERHGDSLVPLSHTFAALRAELESHLWKEERVLFPIVCNLEAARAAGGQAPAAHCGSVNNPIRVMEHEHDSAGRALETMRRLTGNYTLPEGACNTYRALFSGLEELEADLHRHIHLENNILFPRAAQLEHGSANLHHLQD
jgi:regulator of cell morphogenesis and NO signaling